MKKLLLCIGFVALATGAESQEFKDSSIDAVPERDRAIFAAALVSTVSDPFSTQVLNINLVAGSEDKYCGLMNTKNLNGAYTGFKPFIFIASELRLYLDTKCR